MIPVYSTEQNSKQVDIPIFDFTRLGENLFEDRNNLSIHDISRVPLWKQYIIKIGLPRALPNEASESA